MILRSVMNLRIFLSACLLISAGSALQAATCESLSSLVLADTTITSAANAPAAGATVCRVAATIKPSPESHIRIEVWLPAAAAWNGKYLGTGNGGAGGSIANGALAAGIAKGYATANTDMGTTTTGLNFSFGVDHLDLVKDWGYRSTHLMTVTAKQIIRAYYGNQPKYSYFAGCSTGGHQAMTEAERFPDDYDGIVSGDPANNRTRLHTVGFWNYAATHDNLASWIPPSKLPMITKAVVTACDALDGIVDGVIDDPRRCKFDPMSLLCTAGDAPNCLTEPQAVALKKIYAGPHNPRTGELVFPGMSPGSEINPLGLTITLGTAADAPRPNTKGLVDWAPDYKGPNFDFDKDTATVDGYLGKLLNDVNPDLSAFKKHGGKLILYTGWADPLIPAQDTVNFYESVEQKMGDHTSDFARLFMVPGMGHCSGGYGPNRFDALSALEPWVETGKAPEKIVAAKIVNGVTERTRPLCPYPQVARWKGIGSTDNAVNFVCVNPVP
jgi:feruloyl esterase